MIERAVIGAEVAEIKLTDLPIAIRNAALADKERVKILTLAEMEAAYIREILAAAKGNKSQAARALGISRKNLYEKIARYKLQKPE